MMLGDVDSNLDEEASKPLSPSQQQELFDAIENLKIQNSKLEDSQFTMPEYSNSTTKVSLGHTKDSKMFHQNQEIAKKNKLISAELDASIKSFANLQVYTTTEDFGRSVTYDTSIKSFANLQVYTTTEDFGRSVTYDTVIFDATK